MCYAGQGSMDEVSERMREFERALGDFHGLMQASLADLRRSHDELDPLWQDQARRDYDVRFLPLAEHMDRFVHRDCPRYREFISNRAAWLDRYLRGDGGAG
jgi:hypothetical protein